MTIIEGLSKDLDAINSICIPVGLMDQIGKPLKAVANDLSQIKAALEMAVKKEIEAQTASEESDPEEPIIELVSIPADQEEPTE